MAPIAKPKMQLQKTFLREWRRRSNLSQDAAARELNISRPLLSQIENAKSPYTQRLVENAAVLYGCTPAEILAGPGVLNFDLLKTSIESVDEICIRQRVDATISTAEKATMVVNFYRDSLRIIRPTTSISGG